MSFWQQDASIGNMELMLLMLSLLLNSFDEAKQKPEEKGKPEEDRSILRLHRLIFLPLWALSGEAELKTKRRNHFQIKIFFREENCTKDLRHYTTMGRGLCAVLTKCCFCPVWKLPCTPLLMLSCSCLLAPAPRYSWRHWGLWKMMPEWQLAGDFPSMHKGGSLPPSSCRFSLCPLFHFKGKEEKQGERKRQE